MSKSDGLARNTKEVADDVQAFGRDVLKLAGALGDEAKTRIEDFSGDARHQAQAAYGQIKQRVSANPAIALGIAASAGVLIGMLLRGRR